MLVLIASLCLAPGSSRAWDGERTGLILGGGAGPGFTRMPWGDNFISVQLNLEIGYGVTDQWLISFVFKDYVLPRYEEALGLVAHMIAGAQADYFFKPTAPSLLLSGGIGAWVLTPVGPSFGFAFWGGVGFEVSDNFCIGADVALGLGGDSPIGRITDKPSTILSFSLFARVIGY